MPVRLVYKNDFDPFSSIDVPETFPDFSILTGLNGSGKTRFLHAIAKGSITAIDTGTDAPITSGTVLNALTPRISLTFALKRALDIEKKLENAAYGYYPDQDYRSYADTQEIRQLDKIGELLNKERSDLVGDEIKAFALATQSQQSTAFQQMDLGLIGMAHLRTHFHQTTAKILRDGDGDTSLLSILSMDLLAKSKPAPWELASEVLKEFGFMIKGPDINRANAQKDLELAFQTIAGEEVSPDSLSGGERTLLALALAQYSTEHGGGFPGLLLLDESLAALHPMMIGKSLETIRKVFVEKHKIKVMLVSHSPTLVALADKKSIFEVTNDKPNLRICHCSPDTAIGMLTTGIPSLRIDLNNCRQVFVEAPQDEFIYKALYLALRDELSPEIALTFIAAGTKGNSSCDTVTRLVEELRKAGNTTVRGVIDWDNKNYSNKPLGVEVLADEARYAIENIMLDPVLLTFILANSDKGRKAIGGYTQPELHKIAAERISDLQTIVVSVVSKIEESAQTIGRKNQAPRNLELDDSETQAKYMGGFSLSLPKWVFVERGHDYARWVLATFPCLHEYHEGPNNEAEDKLVGAISLNFAANLKNYIPVEVLDLLAILQKPLTEDNS